MSIIKDVTDQQYHAVCDECGNSVKNVWSALEESFPTWNKSTFLSKHDFLIVLRAGGWRITRDERCLCSICQAYKKVRL